jgi:cupin 2 domain-containing protein
MDHNLFDDVPTDIAEERVSDLLVTSNLKIERVISTGQASPPGFWYDQPWAEWVVILTGSAGLKIEGESEIRVMHKGDHIQIPAHRRHRVEWTDSGQPTIWLAVHYR